MLRLRPVSICSFHLHNHHKLRKLAPSRDRASQQVVQAFKLLETMNNFQLNQALQGR